MNWINARLTAVSDLVLAPFASWPPQVTLLAASVLAGVAMAYVFRQTSNQRALRAVADRTRAHLLGLRLFKDDARVAFGCQWELMKAIGLRLWHSLPPMAVLVIPFLFILTQLALRFENRPLEAGESVVVALHLSPQAWPALAGVAIAVPPGVSVETPPLRDPQEQAVYWRLKVDSPTAGALSWSIGDKVVEKSIVGALKAGKLCAVSARRPGPGFWDRLLYPGEPGFAAGSPVDSILVHYPRRSTPIFGLDIPWWASFLVASMAAALCARPFLKVQF